MILSSLSDMFEKKLPRRDINIPNFTAEHCVIIPESVLCGYLKLRLQQEGECHQNRLKWKSNIRND